MGVIQYIGARYVPRFAEPAEWSADTEYESLTIVLHNGNSYTSRRDVPSGVDINNTEYWLETGNYNAQVEAYRSEVMRFDERISRNSSDIDALESSEESLDTRLGTAELNISELGSDVTNLELRVTANTDAIAALDDKIDTSVDRLDNKIDTSADRLDNKIDTSADRLDNKIDTEIGEIEDRFPLQTSDISDGAVTMLKISSDARRALMRNNIGPNSKVVFIGDSYGRGVGGSESQGWPYYVCQALRLTDYINISNSGAGFVREGHSEPYGAITFEEQIDYAYSHMPSNMEPGDVTHVVIGGGYNDHDYSSAVQTAAYNAVRKAMTRFPNAVVSVIPLCCGDRPLTASYVRTYQRIANGAANAGAATTMEGVYWLCPYQIQASSGDQIHPNDFGYQIEGRYIATFLQGGSVWPNTDAWGSSDEGYSVVADATSQGFRTGVQSGLAWFHGNFTRTGFGNLCTLPSYLRPQTTQYFYGMGYADTDHRGVVRFRVTENGVLSAYTFDAGTRDDTLDYTFYIPMTMIPLGNVW